MTLVLVTAPTVELLTLAEAKAHLRVTDTSEDALITSLVKAATAHLDGPYGVLGRAIMEQEWALRLDGFPSNNAPINVDLPPVQSIDEITYIDTDGAPQTLAAENYRALIGGEQPMIEPAYGVSWPTTRDARQSVTVAFTAGHATADDVPAPIKEAALLLIGHWFANREAVITGVISAPIAFAVDAILAPYRNFRD